jgi:amino acid adenylation domain-containing protein
MASQVEPRVEDCVAADEEVFVFPTSFAQQRLWFLDQFQPNSPFYNIPTAVRLTGKLDVVAFERALNEIVRRHETLRTTFATSDGKPVQVIAPQDALPLPVFDLTHHEVEVRETDALRLARDDAQRPFDLSRGPLLRATLIRLGNEEHIVLLTMHHIVSDGWSMGVLISELATLYDAFANNRPSPLPDLPIQYADFAVWQREWLQGDVLESQLAYWGKQLGKGSPILELPADRPRPAVQTFSGATETAVIPRSVVGALESLSRSEGATLFMTLLAAFNVLLYRYTGLDDVSVGTPIANRNRAEIEGLIGVFINTLVLRTDLSGLPTFRQVLQRVREVALGSYAHQDVPFEMLVEQLQPERDMSRSTFFQVMFILQNVPQRLREVSGLTFSQVEAETGSSTHDLTLMVTECPDGLRADVEYNTDLFDATTIRRLLAHFEHLLEGIVADPDQRISALPLTTESETRELLVEWNATTARYPRALACVQELFEQQAEATPDAVAVSAPTPLSSTVCDRQLTYRELNLLANQLAHHLTGMGVGAETRVGICLERSPELIVAVMAVLKAGGAYVPLDHLQPADRLGSMLGDSRVPVVICTSSTATCLPNTEATVIHLDTEWAGIRGQPDTNPARRSRADNLAYMIYTSGSTGKPKGVMIEHRNLVNAYLAWEDAYELKTLQSHLQMANFAFDVFSGDLVRALCSGATLVLCPREFLLAPKDLYAVMESEAVDCGEFVPAVLRNLVQYLLDTGQDLSPLQLLACGSDAWYVGEYRSFRRLMSADARFINSFGLTETTIDSSYFESADSQLPPDRLVPLGRPFPNSRLYVLDGHMQPTPIGVTGELFVGGVGVARGYHGAADMTAERFLPDPYSDRPGLRLYKTGDMARYLPDGNIEFLGRMDFQIKIRGFRIEAGEIETELQRHPAVRHAVVNAVTADVGGDGAAGAKRLVAYVVADGPIDRVPYATTCRVAPRGDDGKGGGSGHGTVEARVTDISRHGVRLSEVPAEWAVGLDLQLRLRLPGVDELEIEGMVTWREGRQAGVLLQPTPVQQMLLGRAVQHLAESGGLATGVGEYNPRVPLRCTGVATFEDGTEGEVTVENLSRGGLRLVGNGRVWRRGEIVRLRLRLTQESNDRHVHGHIWWAEGGRAGVKFQTGELDTAWLDQHVEGFAKEQSFSLSQLRSFLKERLPDYMVPSSYVLLESLPLTTSGKVDRQALPIPDFSQRDAELEFVAPRTESEHKLAEIWSEVLGVGQIGVDDDFFALGGHSLLATQVVSRIRDAFEVELPLRNVFEYTSLRELAERIEILERSAEAVQVPPITPVSRDQALPLSFGQQRLWFLDQLEPGSPFYNIPEATRLTGKLDVALLEKAFNEVVRRHEVLRTTFETVDGKPRQVIANELTIPLRVIDLRDLPREQREQEAVRFASEETRRPFDLARGPLMRPLLVKLADEDHIAVATIHHIVGDLWSSTILFQEVAIIYDALTKGRSSPLPELPVQYADYAYWQREYLSGDVLEGQLSYWREQLSGMAPLLELPTDRARPPVQTYAGDSEAFRLSPALSERVRGLAQAEGATLFMVLLAAFKALLFRYSGETDLCVGTPIANRGRSEVEGLIGFFLNTLALRTDLSREPTFRELLRRVREVALESYAHQDVPFEMVVDAVQPERDLSHSPLFQVMFVLQSAPTQRKFQGFDMPGLELSAVDAWMGTAKFDLTLFMVEEGDRLVAAWEYNTDLFDRETIRRMERHLEMVLEGAVSAPDRPITRLPLLTGEERDRLTEEWNDTAAELPAEQTIHELIAKRGADAPDATALVFGNESVSFGELNARTDLLTRYLRTRGVGRETLVGLCLERSVEMVVSLLAVLKAGGAYVPLDPAYPRERLRYMIEDAGLGVLLTQQRVRERLPEMGAEVVCVDQAWAEVGQEAGEPVESGVGPDNLAYVIYTSGSTGQPKGAMIRHGGVVNYLTWCERTYPLDGGAGAPVHSSIAFDLTVTSVLAPLACGRTVHLLAEEEGVEPLSAALRRRGDYSLVKITPAHLELVAQGVGAEAAAGRTRAFVIGGENLSAESVAFWREWAPETRLINEYGPTETVVGCCVYEVQLGDALRSGVVPIGRPILNTQLYVLDAQMEVQW